MTKIGFGGGCHWCTEAVFQVVKGVAKVEQGWIASSGTHATFSEAVIVHYDETAIDLPTLVAMHLYTHSCTSNHSMRGRYRSAVYTFSEERAAAAEDSIAALQSEFDRPIITAVLPFVAFRENVEKYQNYYRKNSNNQFCTAYINPKFQRLMRQFSGRIDVGLVTDI